jgi:hypothetical protein
VLKPGASAVYQQGATSVVRPLGFPPGTTECQEGPPADCGTDMWNLNQVKLPDLIASQPVPVANPTFVGGSVDTGFDRSNFNLAPVIRTGTTHNTVSNPVSGGSSRVYVQALMTATSPCTSHQSPCMMLCQRQSWP